MAKQNPVPESDPTTAPPPPPVPKNAVAGTTENPAEAPPEAAQGKHKLPFMQQKWVQDILPFATSVVIHAALIVVGLLTFEAAKAITKVIQEQIIIPDATMVENAEAGGIQNPGLGGDPTRSAAQDVDQNVAQANDAWSEKANPSLNQSVMGGSESDNAASAISLGASASFSKGAAKGPGSGEGGGSQAAFGVHGGGGAQGPKSNFAGTTGNATKIVYLCDASGTMMSIFDRLRGELINSVKRLIPLQNFNVIFFQDDQVMAMSKRGLEVANPANKSKAYDFIENTTARGSTDPIPAIKAAFAMKPQLIYILTDGFDAVASFDEVVETFRELNKDKSVKVNCILISTGEQKELVDVLTKIATENGGVMRKVSRDDF